MMNTKAINVYSSLLKYQNEKIKKTQNQSIKKHLSKPTTVFSPPFHYKTTKHSPENRDLTNLISKNIGVIGMKKSNPSQSKNSHNIKKTPLNAPYFNLSTSSQTQSQITQIQIQSGNQKQTKHVNHPNDNPTFTLKYMDLLMKRIPIKASKYSTNPCTSTQTRKTSKEKSEKRKIKNDNKKTQSQSSSGTKLKNNITPTFTNDFKNLLAKFSIIPHLTSQSHTKKTNQAKNANKDKNKERDQKDSLSTINFIKTLNNNTVAYNLNSKNIQIKSINLVSTKQNTINTIKPKKKGAIKQVPKTAKKNLSSQVTIGHNINNNKLFNAKNQYTFQANQRPLKTIFPTPTTLQTFKKIKVSPDYNHGYKVAKTTMEVKKIKAGKLNVDNKILKNNIEKKLIQLTYSKHTENSHKQHGSSYSLTKENKMKDNNLMDNSNVELSVCRESMYYSEESKRIAEYIRSYYVTHNNEYPSTSLQFYKIGRLIGHGAFGKVNISLQILSGRVVAIKSFNKTKYYYSRKKIRFEVRLMNKLKAHKNVIKVYEEIETDKYHCIVMENVNGGNLHSLINKSTKLSETVACFIFKQLVEALKYIHSQGIAHRDIKPDNILIDLNNNIKICDFGVGKEIRPGQLITDTCGTPAFVAPELLKDSPYDPFQSDVWSSGVVLYSMIEGIFPFRGNNESELHRNILSGKYPELIEISPECANLVKQILEVNPSKRITLDQILSHPWINKSSKIQDPTKIFLFTNAEKIIYSKLSADYRNAKKEDLIETFTYKNMDTELENANQNVKTKSFIITPYNSRILDEYEDDLYYSDLEIENEIMKFLPKINELNRDYEINYNAEVDQGFVINHKRKHSKKQINSIHNSFEERKPSPPKHDNKNSNADLDKNDNGNNINNKKVIKDNFSTHCNTFSVDESIIKMVEELGYKRDYIKKSLEGNELNHTTATYWILLNATINE